MNSNQFFRTLISGICLVLTGMFALPLHAQSTLPAPTHQWVGGSGSWTDVAHWDVGTVPAADSIVQILPTEDTTIQLPNSNVSLDSLILSTADAALVLRPTSKTSERTLTVTNVFTMTRAEHAKALVLDQVRMTASSKKLTNLDKMEKLVVKNNALIFMDGSASLGSLSIHENSVLHNVMDATDPTHNVITASELVAGGGYCRLRSQARFGSYRPTPQLSTLIVQPNAVQFLDTSAIRCVGGTGTPTENATQIPITLQFNITGDNRDSYSLYTDGGLADRSYRPATLTEEGFITYFDWGTYKVGLLDATELDNVSIRANAELTEDTTVNALYFALPAKLDLNGHTLTVKSGSIYFNVDQNCYVTNGFLKLENPGLFYHPKYSSNRGIHCPILPADSATIFSAPFGFCGSGLFTGAHQWLSQMKGFVRIPPFGGSGNGASRTITNRSAPDVIWEFEGHSNHPYIGPVKLVDTFAHYRGFAGDGHVIYCVSSVNVKGTNTAAWLGDKEESDTIQTQQLVVGPNGYLLPGSPDEEGYRTGAMVFSMISSAEKGYTNLIFKANSKFCVTVRPDGDCTYLETRNWSKQNTDIIIEGGDIVVTKTERFEPSQSYSIIRAHRPITGNFTNVSSGWKAEVVQTSANLYELMLVPHPSATLMILR